MTSCLLSWLDDVTLPQWGLHFKKRICSNGSKFFSIRVDPISKGDKNETDRAASPGNTPIYLNTVNSLGVWLLSTIMTEGLRK